jgi:hypothetical protein
VRSDGREKLINGDFQGRLQLEGVPTYGTP